MMPLSAKTRDDRPRGFHDRFPGQRWRVMIIKVKNANARTIATRRDWVETKSLWQRIGRKGFTRERVPLPTSIVGSSIVCARRVEQSDDGATKALRVHRSDNVFGCGTTRGLG